jgi:hypothetical protein
VAAAPTEVARVTASAVAVGGAGTYRFEVPAIAASAGRRYRLEISAPAAAPATALGFRATRDQAYAGGALTVGGREQWGDLVFSARAEQATVFRRLEHRLRSWPIWIRSRVTLGALMVIYNWALVVFAWHLLVRDDPAPADEVTA